LEEKRVEGTIDSDENDSELMERDLKNDQGTEAVMERMIAKATKKIEEKMALRMQELSG
jgi:hypothetical protein